MTDGTAAIGTIHFVLMALLAVLVVIGIAWGVRNKRRRVQGRKDVEAHAEEAGVDATTPVIERIDLGTTPVAPPIVGRLPPAPAEPYPASTHADLLSHSDPRAAEPLVDAASPDANAATPAKEALADDVSPPPADGPITQIKGLGPKVAARMAELGIDRVGQLAALDDAGMHALDAQLGPFTGRIVRDRWVEQAKLLASGDRAGFERAFGKLG